MQPFLELDGVLPDPEKLMYFAFGMAITDDVQWNV